MDTFLLIFALSLGLGLLIFIGVAIYLKMSNEYKEKRNK